MTNPNTPPSSRGMKTGAYTSFIASLIPRAIFLALCLYKEKLKECDGAIPPFLFSQDLMLISGFTFFMLHLSKKSEEEIRDAAFYQDAAVGFIPMLATNHVFTRFVYQWNPQIIAFTLSTIAEALTALVVNYVEIKLESQTIQENDLSEEEELSAVELN